MSNDLLSRIAIMLSVVYVIGLVIKHLILKRRLEPMFRSRDPWSVMGTLSVLALAVGMVALFLRSINGIDNEFNFDKKFNFLVAFYPVRFWCILIIAFLALIFWLGSTLERRVAGVVGVLVFASLEVYSVVRVYPSYGWILKGYAALCLVLSVLAIARKFRTHNGPMMSPS